MCSLSLTKLAKRGHPSYLLSLPSLPSNRSVLSLTSLTSNRYLLSLSSLTSNRYLLSLSSLTSNLSVLSLPSLTSIDLHALHRRPTSLILNYLTNLSIILLLLCGIASHLIYFDFRIISLFLLRKRLRIIHLPLNYLSISS